MSGEKLIQAAKIWLPCTKYVVSAGLLWYISEYMVEISNYEKMSASVEKCNLKYEIMASTFNLNETENNFCCLYLITHLIDIYDTFFVFVFVFFLQRKEICFNVKY